MAEGTVTSLRIDSPEFERLLDCREAALLLKVHPETVKRMARRGDLAAVKFGKIWRFRVSALEACVRQMTQHSRFAADENVALSKPAVCAVRNRRV
jgi:excisionase family DNA binding protein